MDVEGLTSLPYEMLADGGFHKEVIRTAFPEYADIPYVKKEPRRNRPAYWLPFFIHQLYSLTTSSKARRLINTHYVVPRIAHSLLKSKPGDFFNLYAVYLAQLAEITDA